MIAGAGAVAGRPPEPRACACSGSQHPGRKPLLRSSDGHGQTRGAWQGALI